MAFAVEVGNDGCETAAFVVYPVFFDIDHVFVQMQVAVGAGVGEEAFGALVNLVNRRAEALFDAGFDLRLQDFGNGDDFFGVYGEAGVLGKLLQYLGGGDEDGGLLRVESCDVRVQGFEQVIKLEAYQRAFDGGVEVAVGTQEEGDAVAGEVGAGQHAFEHIACPQCGLFGGNEKNAPVAAGA